MELAPVHDSSKRVLQTPSSCPPFNIIDALTEPTPSTSKTCSNQCPREIPIRNKVPKEDQLLIAFSSNSYSSESIPKTKNDTTSEKEVQCKILDDAKKMLIKGECNISYLFNFVLKSMKCLYIFLNQKANDQEADLVV